MTTKAFYQSKCPRCGEKITHPIEAATCCLFAPKPRGRCAWCNRELAEKQRVFCDGNCSISWMDHRKCKPPVIVPRPTGWCAWCGNDIALNSAFCGTTCRAQWLTDVKG